MTIIIHGTLGGYKVFYSTQSDSMYARDRRNNTSGDEFLGKTIYSLKTTKIEITYSKYLFVADIVGGGALGYIAFSLVVSSDTKLDGNKIKLLLDEISDYYKSHYIRYNALNQNISDKVIEVDWSFVPNILSKYSFATNPLKEKIVPFGDLDPAYIYYPFTYFDKTNNEEVFFNLEDLLESPFHESFTPFNEVYFIEANQKGDTFDPIIAFKHSDNDLTGKVDLRNPEYTLYFESNYPNGSNLVVKVNDLPFLTGLKFRFKDDISLFWTKPFHEAKKIEVNISKNQLQNVSLDEVNHIATIQACHLEPKTFTFYIQASNSKGQPILDPKFKLITSNKIMKETSKSEIILTEEELLNDWFIKSQKGNFKSQEIELSSDRKDIHLTLNEFKIVEFKVHEDALDGDLIKPDNYEVLIFDRKRNDSEGKIEFIEEELNTEQKLTFRCAKYEEKNLYLIPNSTESPQHLYLLKSKNYKIAPGLYGTFLENAPKYSTHSKGLDIPKNILKVRKGYKFTGWMTDQKNLTLVAQYTAVSKSIRILKIVLPIFLGLALLGLCAWKFYFEKHPFFSYNKKKESKPLIKYDQKIIDTLVEEHKGKVKTNKPSKQEPSIEKNESNKLVSNPKAVDASSNNKNSEKVGNLNIEFFSLVKKGETKKELYCNLLNKYKSDKGEIKDFLTVICKNEDSFKQFLKIPKNTRKSAKNISELNKHL